MALMDDSKLVEEISGLIGNNDSLEYTGSKDCGKVLHWHVIGLAVRGHPGQEVDEVGQDDVVVSRQAVELLSQGRVELCSISPL